MIVNILLIIMLERKYLDLLTSTWETFLSRVTNGTLRNKLYQIISRIFFLSANQIKEFFLVSRL